MSLTTGFDVQFDFKTPNRPFADVYYKDELKNVVEMFCDEAQLPNVQSAVGQINGRYLGEGSVSYPHTRIFTDVGMGFLLDANVTALKFFTACKPPCIKLSSSAACSLSGGGIISSLYILTRTDCGMFSPSSP